MYDVTLFVPEPSMGFWKLGMLLSCYFELEALFLHLTFWLMDIETMTASHLLCG